MSQPDRSRSHLDLVDRLLFTDSPITELGMSTGQASRASVLTSACLRASGASPRRSAIRSDRGSVTRSRWGEATDEPAREDARPTTLRLGEPRSFSCARSSKRTVRLISGVALDQCRVPERYRTRVPFRTPEREVAQAAQRFQKVTGVSRWKRPARGLILCPHSSKHRAGAS